VRRQLRGRFGRGYLHRGRYRFRFRRRRRRGFRGGSRLRPRAGFRLGDSFRFAPDIRGGRKVGKRFLRLGFGGRLRGNPEPFRFRGRFGLRSRLRGGDLRCLRLQFQLRIEVEARRGFRFGGRGFSGAAPLFLKLLEGLIYLFIRPG